jgi:hypothetical protein
MLAVLPQEQEAVAQGPTATAGSGKARPILDTGEYVGGFGF